MPQKTFAGGLAPQNMVKYTLLLVALCLLSTCDNGAPDNAAPAEVAVFRDALKDGGEGPEIVILPTGRFASPRCQPGRTGASGSRFWAGCVMIEDEPFRRNNL